MSSRRDTYWSKRHRYGWGWIPVAWQGWLCVVLYVAFIVTASKLFTNANDADSLRFNLYFLVTVLAATAALIRIGYAKGPRPKWGWGVSDKDNPNENL